MHLHGNRLHPDWIARLEMFRRLTSNSTEPETIEDVAHRDSPESICARWPLPQISYRHRKTAAPRPR